MNEKNFRKIRIYGDPVLRQRASEIPTISPEIRFLMTQMKETMQNARGVGLAAPQVGESIRVIVVMFGADTDQSSIRGLINPEIIWHSEETDMCEEGCLSVPDTSARIKRWIEIKVRAVDEEGNPVEFSASNLTARIIQHEIDHLDGILFIDRLSMLKQEIIVRKLKKALKKETPRM
ncbi:peptide deformylase [bacterium]|nr:peptide deformylase [candidate division CSSED10-310 bacterium]